MTVHVWKNWGEGGGGSFVAWCGRTSYRNVGDSVPMRGELRDADCLDCLRSLRRWALFQARVWAEAAEETVEHMEREKRRRRRR